MTVSLWRERFGAWLVRVQRHDVSASVVITGRTPAEVWTFIRPAESSLLTSPGTIRAFTVAGTGPGVGERQCCVRIEGGEEVTSYLTVTHEIPGVEAESVSDDEQRPGLESRHRYEVRAVPDGTSYTMTSSIICRRWAPINAQVWRRLTGDYIRAHVALVKEHLEADAERPPAVGSLRTFGSVTHIGPAAPPSQPQ